MALSKPRLKAALKVTIEAKIRQFVIANSMVPYPQLTQFSEAMAEAISTEAIDEITANAVVTSQFIGGTFAVSGGGGGTITIPNQTITGTIS